MQDTGKEKREPPPRRGCGGRRRRLGAGAGREPKRASGQAVGQRAAQPAPRSAASVRAVHPTPGSVPRAARISRRGAGADRTLPPPAAARGRPLGAEPPPSSAGN